MDAHGLVIVAREYNHGYPCILKHALDTNLKEYVHKPVGLCGVSAGGFGGTRLVESLLRYGREHVAADSGRSRSMVTMTRMRCPRCRAEMNRHANKVDYAAGHEDSDHVDPAFNGVLQEVHQCPHCGNVEPRRAMEQTP